MPLSKKRDRMRKRKSNPTRLEIAPVRPSKQLQELVKPGATQEPELIATFKLPVRFVDSNKLTYYPDGENGEAIDIAPTELTPYSKAKQVEG